MFSKPEQYDGILFEAFEVSPLNSAAMGTVGRLRRCFPGPALCINKEEFKQPALLSSLAKTLSKMSFQTAVGMTPTVRKAGKDVDEDRDTKDPRLVTELIVAFLQPISTAPTAHRIWKNTREEVLWDPNFMLWRRSPLWLLMCTVMQLLFNRSQMARSSEPEVSASPCLYKLFMLYLFATVLSESIATDISTKPDILSCMSAKIHRRLLKVNPAEHEPGIDFVRSVLERTGTCLEQRWSRIQESDSRQLDLDSLESLRFEDDVSLLLPGLDKFISSIQERRPSNHMADFSPSPDLLKLPRGNLPARDLSVSTDYILYNLNSFENWVASALPEWLNANLWSTDTCAALKTLIEEYHSVARKAYSGNPETSSIMILTLLELWIACDKSAVALFPMLGDYDPGVQLEPLQSLILPFKNQMVRLLSIERYLKNRRGAAHLGTQGSIFRDFGTPKCFSVRFYDTSLEHQRLLQRIEATAAQERREKCQELDEKKSKYDDLMRQYEQSCCDYECVTHRLGGSYLQHAYYCKKCTSLQEAESITICVHEWPLPSQEMEAKSVVFELEAPQTFCAWRDATIFLLLDVFGAEYVTHCIPRAHYSLDTYVALQGLFRRDLPRRLGLLSENKPHVGTHRNVKSIRSTTESDVCLNNGLKFQYYDSTKGCFVDRLSLSDLVPKLCTYELPKKASALQPFLFRTFRGEDKTSNDVISSQSECPENLSRGEYRGLAGILVGYRLPWKNILVQLRCPSIDFNKLETSLVVLQASYQAGPQDTEDFRRAGHFRLADEPFANTLLSAVEEALERIEENRASYQALSMFICIVSRQLSLSTAKNITVKALDILSRLRKVGFTWLELLRKKRDKTENEGQRREFAKEIVTISLICSGTFDVGDNFLEDILSKTENASILIQCGIMVQELLSNDDVGSRSSFMSILHSRWQRLSYRSYPVLVRQVMGVDETGETSLDIAVRYCWPVFQRHGCWETATSQIDYWVVCNTDSQADRSLRVQCNLLTGQLLVNGLPLSRLPFQYEKHDSYREILGGIVLQIMPSSIPGMQFSAKQSYAGHFLHFGFDGPDLRVRATRGDHAFELVPKRALRDMLPLMFLEDFVQWYDTTTDAVEFRSRRQPWNSTDDTWILAKDEFVWKLRKNQVTLVNPASPTGKQVAGIFAPLQKPLQINITLSSDSQRLEVELPRLKLGFQLEKGMSAVLSRQFRGLEVDSDQFIGTLIGLKDRLVLKDASTDDRRVIVPAGKVRVEPDGDHVSVSIDPSPTSTYCYRLDTILGSLRDNGSLQSKLFLCHLHALTSFCLPDTLTHNTGTEQALTIIKSAAVRSSPFLTDENMSLLGQIELLTPRRVYYPTNEHVMQTVKWKSQLPILAQHPHFHQCVVDLWEQNELTKLYNPESYAKPPEIREVDSLLLRRDNLRASTFRISGFGAEDFSDALDVVYASRDLGQSSKRSNQAGLAAAILFYRQPHLQYRVFSFKSRFSNLVETVDHVQGPDKPEVPRTILEYDGRWLEGHPKHWANLWCWLHRQSQLDNLERPQLRMWLATMAFSSEVDMDMIQVAASMFTLPQMRQIQTPHIREFHLRDGDRVNTSELSSLIRLCCRSVYACPEYNLPKHLTESYDKWWNRIQNLYEGSLARATESLVSHLDSKWPDPSPLPPSGSGADFISTYIDLDQAMNGIRPKFKSWYENMLFSQYLNNMESTIGVQTVLPLRVESLHIEKPQYKHARQKMFISSRDLFASTPPENLPNGPKLSNPSLQGCLRERETTTADFSGDGAHKVRS